MRLDSLAVRSILALALMIGFYVFALAIVGGLLWLPYAELVYAHRLHAKLALACVVGAGSIAWAILPRRDEFQPPGPRLERTAQPALFALIERVARATGEATPRDVYLVPDMNAWVSRRGGVMGFGSAPVMGIGLPLLQVTSRSELRAILAHEFGHYCGGDTQLGPWIYKTRAAIGRTLESLSQSALQAPFRGYAALFLRLTQAISRAQELSADRLAVRVAGGSALVGGLEKVHGYAGAFDSYWRQEFAPVLSAGFHAPFVDGFSRFLAVPSVAESVRQQLAAHREPAAADPYDSHPPLAERVAAARALAAPEAAAEPDDDAPALTLLRELPALESSAVRHLLKGKQTPPLAWEDVPRHVLEPRWRRIALELAPVLERATLRELPARVAQRKLQLLQKLAGRAEVPREYEAALLVGPLGAAVASALIAVGWRAETLPGEAITMRRADASLEPFPLVGALFAAEDEARAAWERALEEHGIGDVSLLAAD